MGHEHSGVVCVATGRLSLAAYLVIAIGLGIFGYLAMFSIGFPFLLTAVLMLVLTAARHRAAVMVPALVWPWIFTLGYILVAPIGCSTLAMPQIADGGRGTVEGSTRCNALFLTYAGDASYSPPLWPALVVGVVLATGASLIARRWITRRVRRTETTERVP